MPRIAWFHLETVPQNERCLDALCKLIKEKVWCSDEIYIFLTGHCTLNDVTAFKENLVKNAVRTNSVFIALGSEYYENRDTVAFNSFYNCYSESTQSAVHDGIANNVRKPISGYINSFGSIVDIDSLMHEDTIHYYWCKDSLFVLHINTTVNRDINTTVNEDINTTVNEDINTTVNYDHHYVVDASSIERLMKKSNDSSFRIAFGRESVKHNADRFSNNLEKVLKENSEWLFYLCSSNIGESCINMFGTAQDGLFYEINLYSEDNNNAGHRLIAGYYDTENEQGFVRLYQYKNGKWNADYNFPGRYSDILGVLFYPNNDENNIKKCIKDEVSFIVKSIINCNFSNKQYCSGSLHLEKHENIYGYIIDIYQIIDYQFKITNKNETWKIALIPDFINPKDSYPNLEFNNIDKLLIICFIDKEAGYNEKYWNQKIDGIKSSNPNLCIFDLKLYKYDDNNYLRDEVSPISLLFGDTVKGVSEISNEIRSNYLREFTTRINPELKYLVNTAVESKSIESLSKIRDILSLSEISEISDIRFLVSNIIEYLQKNDRKRNEEDNRDR